MTEPFANAPDLGKDFNASKPPEPESRRLEPDAADWEPVDDHEDDTPDELRHDPPRKVFVPGRVYEPTPFGTVEREVRRELGPAEQRAIADAERRPRDLDDEFNDLRSVNEVPGAAAEYEEHLRREEPWHEDYERHVRERFNRMKERSPDRGR